MGRQTLKKNNQRLKKAPTYRLFEEFLSHLPVIQNSVLNLPLTWHSICSISCDASRGVTAKTYNY
jgi:hypothetical protein